MLIYKKRKNDINTTSGGGKAENTRTNHSAKKKRDYTIYSAKRQKKEKAEFIWDGDFRVILNVDKNNLNLAELSKSAAFWEGWLALLR